MITFKSTVETTINSVTNEQGIVYMEIKPIIYSGDKFTAPIFYYTKKEVQISENPDTHVPLMKTMIVPLEKRPPVEFSRAECIAIQGAIQGGFVGTDFPDWYDQLIMTGLFYQLSVKPIFGLTASQWVQVV